MAAGWTLDPHACLIHRNLPILEPAHMIESRVSQLLIHRKSAASICSADSHNLARTVQPDTDASQCRVPDPAT